MVENTNLTAALANSQVSGIPPSCLSRQPRHSGFFRVLFGDWRIYSNFVWYEWTAPADGWSSFDLTTGTTFGSLLAVFTGNEREQLVAVATNDNYGSNTASRVRIAPLAGINYPVLVAGNDKFDPGKSGNFPLRRYPTPPSFCHGLYTRVGLAWATTRAHRHQLQRRHGNFTMTNNLAVLVLPMLAARPLSNNLVKLSWPSTPGFTLQRADNIGATPVRTMAQILSSRLPNGTRVVVVTNAVSIHYIRLDTP